jgi:hypothetical protein
MMVPSAGANAGALADAGDAVDLVEDAVVSGVAAGIAAEGNSARAIGWAEIATADSAEEIETVDLGEIAIAGLEGIEMGATVQRVDSALASMIAA